MAHKTQNPPSRLKSPGINIKEGGYVSFDNTDVVKNVNAKDLTLLEDSIRNSQLLNTRLEGLLADLQGLADRLLGEEDSASGLATNAPHPAGQAYILGRELESSFDYINMLDTQFRRLNRL